LIDTRNNVIDTAGDSVSVLLCVVVEVMGVTQLHDVVYIVCQFSSTINRFHATTHERLTDINVKDLSSPWDIASCKQTSQLYVTDWLVCIWRVSSSGEDIKRWWTKSPSDTFEPNKLSVTSSRVLVTSRDPNELMQLDAAGKELRRVPLPDYMRPYHAVESPTGTFVVENTQLKQCHVSEVNTEGEVLRQFSRSVDYTPHIAIDSQGNIFVADSDNRLILLLDAHLELRRVIIDEHQLNYKKPYCLCYNEQSGQLLIGLHVGGVAVFDVLQRRR